MDRTRIHEGARRMRFEGLLDRQERGELSQFEAGAVLGISERSFRQRSVPSATTTTVRWRRLSPRLPPSRLRPHLVRATVRVHEYPDGTITVFLAPHRLADYDARGRIITTIEQAA